MITGMMLQGVRDTAVLVQSSQMKLNSGAQLSIGPISSTQPIYHGENFDPGPNPNTTTQLNPENKKSFITRNTTLCTLCHVHMTITTVNCKQSISDDSSLASVTQCQHATHSE